MICIDLFHLSLCGIFVVARNMKCFKLLLFVVARKIYGNLSLRGIWNICCHLLLRGIFLVARSVDFFYPQKL